MTDPAAPLQLPHRPGRRRRAAWISAATSSRSRAIWSAPIEEVSAATATRAQEPRRRRTGRKPVAIDDHSAFRRALRERRASATITASWVTPGRKMQLEFELVGTRGSLVFSQERFNELQLYTAGDQKRARRLQDAARRSRHAALRQFLPGARPSARLQRSEDDRGRASDRIDRRGNACQPGFPRGLRDPARHRGGRPGGPGAGLAAHRGCRLTPDSL